MTGFRESIRVFRRAEIIEPYILFATSIQIQFTFRNWIGIQKVFFSSE